MNQSDTYRPTIPPVPEGVTRPLWSVMIPTYNCAGYLRETLASVLAQDPGSDVMQIAVVDNHSTEDNPAAVVEELGKGRVEFYQQPMNVGSLKNFQTCFELSRGHLIHLLHSDDCVREGFYQKMARPFREHPEIGAAFCRSIYINYRGDWKGLSSMELPESGILPSDWITRIAEVCCISVPTLAVVRREVYEKLGGWDSRCGLSGDWEMWVRIFANYPMWFETEPLAMWRSHTMSNNVVYAKSRKFIQENFNTIAMIFQSYIPNGMKSKSCKQAKQNCAFLALQSAESLFAKGDMFSASAQIQLALTCSSSFIVIRSAIRIFLWKGILSLLQKLGGDDKYQSKLSTAAGSAELYKT
ncbi:glycosyltransferase family 2 protein [Mastigocladopsis repens]|uniref:glycosyltransferase family 2 protein n=1 Tax=Mastigocladopsis repens TaxID=221287 RepID=UPI0002E3E0DE|nr:glycosyltransferase [Mastigocladopsis repens]